MAVLHCFGFSAAQYCYCDKIKNYMGLFFSHWSLHHFPLLSYMGILVHDARDISFISFLFGNKSGGNLYSSTTLQNS